MDRTSGLPASSAGRVASVDADRAPTLEALWEADDGPPLERFDHAMITELHAPARRYLEHSVESGAPLYRAVRLRMHGEIKLGWWHPFMAEQVVRFGRGLIWRAQVRLARVLPIVGQDSFVDGRARMRWKLLGIIPVMRAGEDAQNPDLDRSAAGRAALETIFVPTSLASVEWIAGDDEHVELMVPVSGDRARLRLRIDEQGRLREVSMLRWGNPEGGNHHEVSFGATLDADRRFGQLTIPTRIRAGWYFGSPRFTEEGEFFRATIDSIEFR